jgi:two-component system, NarL family, sensor histidine kinase DesK
MSPDMSADMSARRCADGDEPRAAVTGAWGEAPDRRGLGAFNGRSRRWRWSFAALVWLVFLAPAINDTVHADHGIAARAATLLVFAAFSLVYILSVPLTAYRAPHDPLRYAVPVVALALGLLTIPVAGEEGLSTFVYVAVIAVGLLPTRIALGYAGFVAVLAATLDLTVPGWNHDPGSLLFSIVLATAATAAFVRLLRRNAELALARGDLARLAVEQERARFARDLHDLLGHSLTVITVKSELAGRLMTRDPVKAAAEVADIERLAREALADVRATVGGYREVTLAAEVSSARSALDAAGIAAELPGALDEVPGTRRELFGWVVREGVTNVVRHSRAHRVQVRVSPTTVEVVDDGAGCPGTSTAGHGLDGLRERVDAVDGRLEAGPIDGGGFRLFVEVPVRADR